jgi:hypothetical protein
VLREQDKYCGFISALIAAPILYYFESREHSDLEARVNVRKILRKFTIIDLTTDLIQKAFDEKNIPDFDIIQQKLFCAMLSSCLF